MKEILNIAIGSVTVGGIIILLGKFLINKGFDIAIQTFENKFELLKIEHQIRYSALHEERAQLLKFLYRDLYKLETELKYFTSIFQGPDWTQDSEREINARKQLQKCFDTLEENRIFFSKNFCNELKSNLDECSQVVGEMGMTKVKADSKSRAAQQGMPYRSPDGKSPLDSWMKLAEKVNTEITQKRIDLADSFRELIGVK